MKKLVIDSGDEYRAKIEKEFTKDSFFYEVYCKAYDILLEIEEEAEQFNKNRKCKKEKTYLRIGNNIIAFSSTRGQGKTSALQSFSKYIKEYDIRTERLGRRTLIGTYYVLSKAIDPTALTNGESIARVFVSRLFEEFKHDILDKVTKSGSACSDEIEKHYHEIMELFQRCYSSIDCISGVKKADYEDDDLENLAQLGSSSKLRENISELIDNIFGFIELGCVQKKSPDFLVVSIDDADLTMKNTYKICEEIRTYFSSSNIIVLLAADFQQIEHSIEQVYIRENDILLKYHNSDGDNLREKYLNDCHEMAAKYVEKMFPSGHRVELPTLDNWISEKSGEIMLTYNNTSKKQYKNNGLLNCKDLQEQLLKLLFDRTGMIFLKKQEHLHAVLPVTLRELNHFVKMLYSMQCIRGEWHKENNIKTIEKNIKIFEQYFFSYWCPNRLDEYQQLLLSDIQNKKKSNKEVSRLLKAYVRKQSDEKIEIALEDEYLKILFEVVDEISGFPNEEMLKQAIYIYYTIFLNKWFYHSWKKQDEKKEMKKFVSFINHSIYLPESVLKSKFRKKYSIGNFSCDNALLKYFLPCEDNFIIFEYIDWLGRIGKIVTKESYPDFEEWEESTNSSIQGQTENNLEFDWIEELKVNVLDSLLNILVSSDIEDLPEKNDAPTNIESLSEGVDALKKERHEAEFTKNGLQLLFSVKNILVNVDVQFFVSRELQKLFRRFYARKTGRPIDLIHREIYEEVDKWVEQVDFMQIKSSVIEHFNQSKYNEKDRLSRLCLCNRENFHAYCEELNASNMRWEKRIDELTEKKERLALLVNKEALGTEEEKEIKGVLAETEKKEDYDPQIFSCSSINESEKGKNNLEGPIGVFIRNDLLKSKCTAIKQAIKDLIKKALEVKEDETEKKNKDGAN